MSVTQQFVAKQNFDQIKWLTEKKQNIHNVSIINLTNLQSCFWVMAWNFQIHMLFCAIWDHICLWPLPKHWLFWNKL